MKSLARKYCIISLFTLILIPSKTFCQNNEISFITLNGENGLSNNYVSAIFEDKKGFKWFATAEGLSRWDGYNFKVYLHTPGEKNTISGNFILCINEDNQGNIWIGMNQTGLSKFNVSEESFENYKHIPGDETSISGTVIRDIHIDNNENIWIATNNGLSKYIPTTNKFKKYYFEQNNQNHSTHVRDIIQIKKNELIIQNSFGLYKMDLISEKLTHINDILPEKYRNFLFNDPKVLFDSEDNIWIGTREGLLKHNRTTKQSILFKHIEKDPSSLSSNRISKIFEDSKKNIWVGTENNGINLYNKNTNSFKTYSSDQYKKNTLSDNIVTNIYEDRNGFLWFSTQEGGVSYINNSQKLFEQYTHNPFNSNSLFKNKVTSFYEDDDENIWIGTSDGGICRLDKKGQFKNTQLKTEIMSPSILAIQNNPLKENKIFISGWGIGLYELNTNTFQFKNLFNQPTQLPNRPNINIKGMNIDSTGNVWLATHDGNGVVVYDQIKKDFYDKNHPGDFNSEILGSPYPVSMVEDSKYRKWIITYTGLYMLDSLAHSFHCVKEDSNTLSSNYVYTIHEDSKNNIWIGNADGLDILIEKNGKFYFERLSQKYNIPINIKGILEDDNGILWLSSNQGIVTFDPETKQTMHIIDSKELPNQLFLERSCYKTRSGEMLFGGTNGFLRFHPDTIFNSQFTHKLFIVDFQIFNVSQNVNDKNSPLKKTILDLEEIELNHKQSSIGFEYVALDFNSIKTTEFAYMLEGFDKDWFYVGNKTFASYTNLPPGSYTFRVKTVSGYSNSNNEIALKVTIHPPIWRTKVAYISYVLFIILLLYFFRRLIINREKFRNELKMERLEVKAIQESNLMKLRFFTNISHEFRTPLTLIKAPLDKLINTESHNDPEELKSQLSLIKRSSDKLLKMVNQLMDYRKLEAGSLVLETCQGDIVEFCKKTWDYFNVLATQRKIKYEFKSSVNSLIMNFDADKLDKIISNLISNSIKNTDENGHIVLSIKKKTKKNKQNPESVSEYIVISVKDTGIGIPKKDLPYIFDRFYSAQKKDNENIEGTGIGLTLAKELTELHGGKISVSSKIGEGTKFTASIPIILEEPSISENIDNELTDNNFDDQSIMGDIIEQQIANNIESKKHSEKRFKILVVEDDPDLRAFIRNDLINDYEVLTANDGEDGMRKAFFNFPDLILSDVMMPNMNGFELTKIIKSDEKTSHIPVILLTARQSEEKHIEGYDAGADDYIYKPFNITLLKSRIHNILLQRTELIEKFNKGTSLDFVPEGVHQKDKDLIQSIIDIVLENISEEKINAEFICNKIHISRSLLYVKIEAISGMSVNEFIRGIRLKKATQLILQKKLTITEIAYSVGFSSQPYFSRCFTKLYGMSPSEYQPDQIK